MLAWLKWSVKLLGPFTKVKLFCRWPPFTFSLIEVISFNFETLCLFFFLVLSQVQLLLRF